MRGERDAAFPLPPVCQTTRARLGRFLDNDLSAADAGRIAGHLTECVGCRHEYERLGEVKSALRALNVVPAEKAEDSRARVLARLESAVERGEKGSARIAPPGNWLAAWCPMAATLSAAALIGIGFFAYPVVTPPDRTGEPARAVSLLPDAEELTFLTNLHDAHGAAFSWDEPVARRDRSAAARARLLDVADAAAAGSL